MSTVEEDDSANMEDINFWDGEEAGFDNIEDILNIDQSFNLPVINQYSSNLPTVQSYYDEESILNDFSLSHVGGSRCPLGLSLNRTPSFLYLLQRSISEAEREKVKAVTIPVISIKIGNWQLSSMREGHLTAKLYYAKRKLIWEVLEGPLKYKIEMQWSNISAIRETMLENVPGTLEVELSNPPLFFQEEIPQPGKHTEWKEGFDFTWGQASFWRKHMVRFQPGILDKHYAKLLQCDKRLFDLSQKPFPTEETSFSDELFSNHSRNLILS